MKKTIYSAVRIESRGLPGFRRMARYLSDARHLAWQLTVRDIKGLYRQSFLGFGWAFIMPLANSIVWIFLQVTGIIRIESTGMSYPLFAFSGALLWSVFMESLQAPLTMTTNARSMLSKVRFPYEAILLSGIYQTLFNGMIKVALILVVFISFGIYPGLNLLLFPFAFLSLILMGTAIGLFLTPAGMLYTDVGRSLPIILQLLMYTTPVVFPIPSQGWISVFFHYNPLTQIFMPCRDWLTGTATIYMNGFLIVNGAMILLLLFSWMVYRLVMPVIVERMNA